MPRLVAVHSAQLFQQSAWITYSIFRTFDLPLALDGWYKQEEQDL
jgi:hypothetical protein